MDKRRLIIGISGASGMPITVEILRQIRAYNERNAADCGEKSLGRDEMREYIETHLVYTRGAEMTLEQECSLPLQKLCELADVVHDNSNIGAAPASGSFQTAGMIIVPCSMKTVAGIHSGYSDNLLLRAADVTLKERRKLVLVARECPLGTIHLRNMYELSMMGAIIIPPMLSYYNHPSCVEDMTRHIAGKVLDQFGLEVSGYRRWNGMDEKQDRIEVSQEVLGRRITASVTVLDHGIHVLLSGGDRSHVGAVYYADGSGAEQYQFQAEGHREAVVSESWARKMAEAVHMPVTVACGIHYDGVGKEEIAEIVRGTGEMLEKVLEVL